MSNATMNGNEKIRKSTFSHLMQNFELKKLKISVIMFAIAITTVIVIPFFLNEKLYLR